MLWLYESGFSLGANRGLKKEKKKKTKHPFAAHVGLPELLSCPSKAGWNKSRPQKLFDVLLPGSGLKWRVNEGGMSFHFVNLFCYCKAKGAFGVTWQEIVLSAHTSGTAEHVWVSQPESCSTYIACGYLLCLPNSCGSLPRQNKCVCVSADAKESTFVDAYMCKQVCSVRSVCRLCTYLRAFRLFPERTCWLRSACTVDEEEAPSVW